MAKVLIAVSGTGGHVYPGVALAQELRSRRPGLEVLFATARGKPAVGWIRAAGFEVREIRLQGFARRPSWSWVTFPFALIAGLLGSLTLLLKQSPQLVVGTGGYAAGPLVLFAALMGIPTVILEQNSVPGVTTKLTARVAKEVHVAQPETVSRLPRSARVHVSGNPVRLEVERGRPDAFREAFGLEATRPVVLVVGGSQGARALTEAALDATGLLGPEFPGQLVVQAGRRGYEDARRRAEEAPDWVRVTPFLDDIGGAYAAASLVVSRAGAMTLAELSAAGVGAILVPYPYASEDHQTVNAERYAVGGAARVLPQSELGPERLASVLGELMGTPGRLEAMAAAARESEQGGARERVATACEKYLA